MLGRFVRPDQLTAGDDVIGGPDRIAAALDLRELAPGAIEDIDAVDEGVGKHFGRAVEGEEVSLGDSG